MYGHFEQMVQSGKECIKWNKLATGEQTIVWAHPYRKKFRGELKNQMIHWKLLRPGKEKWNHKIIG